MIDIDAFLLYFKELQSKVTRRTKITIIIDKNGIQKVRREVEDII